MSPLLLLVVAFLSTALILTLMWVMTRRSRRVRAVWEVTPLTCDFPQCTEPAVVAQNLRGTLPPWCACLRHAINDADAEALGLPPGSYETFAFDLNGLTPASVRAGDDTAGDYLALMQDLRDLR